MRPGSAKPGDARASRQPSPRRNSPLGRRPLTPEERPSSSSRAASPHRTREPRAKSPAKVGAPYGDAAFKQRGLGMRAWLRIDPTGDTQIIEADKYAIMRRCAIPARDLRILDPVLVYPSTILGREKAIVINLEHIKAIVTAEEVLLQNYQNPHVQLFVTELQRRLPPQRDPHTLELPSPPPRSLSPPLALHPPSSDTGADLPPRSGVLPWAQQAGPAPERGPLSESLLLAPGLTARPALPGQGARAVAQAAVGMEAQGARGKSPLGRGSASRGGKGGEARPRRMEARWQDLQRENSLRGRSWSPVRRPAVEGPKRSPRGTTHSPGRGGSKERVRSLSPPRGLRQEAAAGGARGAYAAYVGAERGARGASPGLQRGRSPAPLPKNAVWAPLAALREKLLGRKKSYQRIVVSPDTESRHPSPLPSSQVLYLEDGGEAGGAPFAAQGGSAPVVLPFEFRALEVILETVCGHLDVKAVELEADAYPALDDLTVKISAANLERVRRFKSRLVGLSVRVQKVRDELEGLLDDDGDMREMYLTAKLLDTLDPFSPQSAFTAAGAFGSVLAASPPRLSQGGPAPYRLPPFPPGGSAPRPAPLPLLDLSLPGPALQGAPTPRLGPVQPSILDVGFPSQGQPPSAAPQLTRELTFDLRVGQGEAAQGPEEDRGEEGTGGQAGRGEGGTGAEDNAGSTGGEARDPAATHGEAEDLVSPLLRHASSHSQRSVRRGRSRSRSRSGSRSRGSRSVSRSSRSSKSTRKSSKGEDVEELEMLLEAYFAQIEGTLNKLSALREYIEDTEDYITIRLDDHQNQLLLLQIVITVGTVAATIAVVVSGVFGMNIQCSFYHSPKYFPWVMWSTLAACLIVAIGIVGWLKWKKLLSL